MQDLRSSFMATGGRLTTKPGLFSYRNTYHEAVEEDESETTVSAEIDEYSLFYLLSCRWTNAMKASVSYWTSGVL